MTLGSRPATAAGCYLLKLAGLSVPERWLEQPAGRAISALLPVALLAALAAVQTFADRRAAGARRPGGRRGGRRRGAPAAAGTVPRASSAPRPLTDRAARAGC